MYGMVTMGEERQTCLTRLKWHPKLVCCLHFIAYMGNVKYLQQEKVRVYCVMRMVVVKEKWYAQ